MSHPKFKKGDIVVVLEDEKDMGYTFLKAGEVCEVWGFVINPKRIHLRSLNPSFGVGIWFTDIDNVELAPEMLEVLS
jgi:hypothetical protein